MACPPSNGTMGELWMAQWCYRCRHDHLASHGSNEEYDRGCPHLLATISEPAKDHPHLRERQDPYPAGWDPAKLECLHFDRCPCEDDGDWQPPPPPDPNQGLLFEVTAETFDQPCRVVMPEVAEVR